MAATVHGVTKQQWTERLDVVDLELAVASAQSKASVIEALSGAGHHALSGHVRLAYPFTVTVQGLPALAIDDVLALAQSIDPGAAAIPAPVPAPAHLAATT